MNETGLRLGCINPDHFMKFRSWTDFRLHPLNAGQMRFYPQRSFDYLRIRNYWQPSLPLDDEFWAGKIFIIFYTSIWSKMKNNYYFSGFFLFIGFFPCQTKGIDYLPATLFSSQNLEFGIFVPLVVGYLGNFYSDGIQFLDESPFSISIKTLISIFVADETVRFCTYKRLAKAK